MNMQETQETKDVHTLKAVEKKDPKKIILIVVLGLTFGLFVTSFTYTYLFSGDSKSLITPLSKDSLLDSNKNSVVMNPLTGEEFTESEATLWKDIRPLAVMINNYTAARPQSGLIDADLVYEIVAEGGITRFIAFFQSKLPEKVGPIRSARHYYLVLVKELGDAMFMHIGWSPQALNAIETWPVKSLGRGQATFWRDATRLANGVATEHTAYSNAKDLVQTGLELGWDGTHAFDIWKFKDDSNTQDNQDKVNKVTIDFWYKGDYSAIWEYDASSNSYLRYTGYDNQGVPIAHVDQETQDQMSFKNVIVQFAVEKPIVNDPKHRLDYELIGSGEGLVFIDGTVYNVTWSKESREERTIFYDENGVEMEFNRGKFWISIVPERNKEQVVY